MLFALTNTIYWRGQKWPYGVYTIRTIFTFVVRIYTTVIPILFKTLLDCLVHRFNRLGAKLRLTAAAIDGDESCRKNSPIVFSCYEAHTSLVDLVELLDSGFGLQMLYLAILNFALMLMFIIDNHTFIVLMNFVYIARLFYAINASAEKLLIASETILDKLSITPLFGLSQSALLQVEVWMLQFESSAAEVSFASFFTLSKSAYVSMVLAATTYSILILQLVTAYESPAMLYMFRGFVVHL